MRAAKVFVLAVVFTLLGALPSTQVITRGYVYANIGTVFSWSGSAQNWSGSTVTVTCLDWTSYIQNDGTACPNLSPANSTVTSGYASAHAQLIHITHSPLVSNNTFSGGTLSPWTSSISGACSGASFSGSSSVDQDGDNGLMSASSLSCASTTSTLAQTFTISGTSPANQTYSFWYKAPTVTVGSSQCTQGAGTVTLTFIVNSTTIKTISSPVMTNAWTQVSGTLTNLANGSNSVSVQAVLSAASGQYYFAKNQTCGGTVYRAQTLSLDNFVLTATW